MDSRPLESPSFRPDQAIHFSFNESSVVWIHGGFPAMRFERDHCTRIRMNFEHLAEFADLGLTWVGFGTVIGLATQAIMPGRRIPVEPFRRY